MATFADLEIGLHRRDAGSYVAELRLTLPESEADIRPGPDGQAPFQLDLLSLNELPPDSPAYAQALGDALFGNPDVRASFAQARSAAAALGVPLRLRLLIGPSAPELHGVRWETLRDPQNTMLLSTSGDVFFSRYLASGDWRPIKLRPRGKLRALACVANPSDLADYRFAPIDVAGELAQASAGLGTIPLRPLEAGAATLDGLLAGLRDGCDILYLVAHGTFVRGEPWLWLEDASGAAARVSGDALAARLHELQDRPRLVVLASCQSAGGDGARTALGAKLAAAGIPAVIAMQGDISQETVARLTASFFVELQRDGQIDRALAVARGQVRDRPDAWMPALFMRLKNGRLWYVPGFGDNRAGFEKWPALLRSIKRGQCTPLIGAALTASLLGPTQEIARRWAETYRFPMAPHDREDLPQVAQFLSVNQDPRFPRDELIEHLRGELIARYPTVITPELHEASLSQLFAAVGAAWRAQDGDDPYTALASLPFPIFITTNISNLLVEALRSVGKQPQVEICRWHSDLETLPSVYDDEPDYQPSAQRPLVYHLFGNCDEPDSLVVTEDDYFDYLIGVSTNKDLIPIAVRQALADTALLFLGFRLDDWNFRVIFRSLMLQEGRSRRSRHAHIAGQVLPEEGRFLEPDGARAYLERYFQDADISIYWGSAEDFTRELRTKM